MNGLKNRGITVLAVVAVCVYDIQWNPLPMLPVLGVRVMTVPPGVRLLGVLPLQYAPRAVTIYIR